jgi:hypothetical protein
VSAPDAGAKSVKMTNSSIAVIAVHFTGITMRKLPKSRIKGGKLPMTSGKRTTCAPVAAKNWALSIRIKSVRCASTNNTSTITAKNDRQARNYPLKYTEPNL